MFEIIPAIDLKAGHCVRLTQGRAGEERVYSEDPVTVARRWEAEGAMRLHVVDLDGAFNGAPAHAGVVAAIAGALAIPVQVGGGIRTDADVRLLLEGGAQRVIIGTRACAEPAWIEALVRAHGGARIVVGIDARDGMVQVRGWVETTDLTAATLARRMVDLGVGTLIYTDTARDGMLQGPNLAAVEAFCAAASCTVIASGGIKDAGDVTALRGLGCPNLQGVIVGKALYEGRVDLKTLMTASRDEG